MDTNNFSIQYCQCSYTLKNSYYIFTHKWRTCCKLKRNRWAISVNMWNEVCILESFLYNQYIKVIKLDFSICNYHIMTPGSMRMSSSYMYLTAFFLIDLHFLYILVCKCIYTLIHTTSDTKGDKCYSCNQFWLVFLTSVKAYFLYCRVIIMSRLFLFFYWKTTPL